MVGPIKQRDLDVNHREARQHAVVQSLFQTLFNRRNKFARHRTALDGINELKALAGLVRPHLDPDVAVLTLTARLLGMLAFLLDFFADRLAVSNLRRTDVGLNAEL